MITTVLIAHGFDPAKLARILDDYYDIRQAEIDQLRRNGGNPTRKSRLVQDHAQALKEALQQEDEAAGIDKIPRYRTGLN